MTRLIWDQTSDRDYEVGVDRGVFYPTSGPGCVWNGLITVEESPSDVESQPRYLDGRRIRNSARRGQFNATVEAFTYPEVADSGLTLVDQRIRGGLSYRTATAKGHKIHLVFNALLTPTDSNFVHNEMSTFGWDLTTRGMPIVDGVIASHMVIDTSVAYPETIDALEAVIYGSASYVASLPTPADVLQIFEENSIL